MRLFVVLSLCVATSLAQTLQQETCDATRTKVDVGGTDADVVISGIFDMRYWGSNGYGCGGVHLEEMLAYEATRWTLNRINNDDYVPGVKIGMTAYDVCYSQQMTVDAVNDLFPQYSSSSVYCNDTGRIQLGVLGGFSSWTTKAMGARLADFPASSISPTAGSPELSDKKNYPYVMRTTPSSALQTEAMDALFRALSWERVVVVYMDNDYGRDSMNEFVRQSRQQGVCVIGTVAVPGIPNFATYRAALEDIGRYDVTGGVFFGEHVALKQLMSSMDAIYRDTGTAGNIQWAVSYLFLHEIPLADRMNGVVYVQPGYTVVDEFFDYFTNDLDENSPPAENPWYKDWFMETFQCRLTGVNYEPYERYSACSAKTPAQKLLAVNTRYSYLDATIKAVYAFARALRDAQQATCGGGGGVCLGLQRMSPQVFHEYLLDVSFDMSETGITSLDGQRVEFDANGDLVNTEIFFINYNDQPSGDFSYKQFGTYSNGALSVDQADLYMYNDARNEVLPALPSSQCPARGCRNCVVPRPEVSFNYRPGDVIIGALFDIHAQGSEILTCGNLKASHAMNAAAFVYALNTVKSQFPNLLNGVDIGSLIVDLCDNAETGRMFLNNILGGRHIVSSPNGIVDPYKVQGVMGELDSTEATSMALMLGSFGIPYIESSATSIYLSMSEMFPTFTRAVPSDEKQMHAIILLLKRYGWNHIQVVYSAGDYGRSGYGLLKRFGASNSICVSAAHEIDGIDDVPMVVQNLNKSPEARAVIAVVDDDEVRAMLETIQTLGLGGRFLLIGTESWGRSMGVINGVEDVAEGSITMNLVSPALAGFRSWIDSLDATEQQVVSEMPFFTEWYQYVFNCYLHATNRGIYQQECTSRQTITLGPNYSETPFVGFTIKATYALVRAIDQTLKDFCGDANGVYNGVCTRFRGGDDVKGRILKYLQDSEFTVSQEMFKMIDGEGQANYDMYAIRNGGYVKIGTYMTEEGVITLDNASPINIPQDFESRCSGFCSECVYMLQTQPFTIFPGPQLKIGVNVAIHNPSTDQFICGPLRLTNGFQSALAITYALDQVNSGKAPVSLNGVDLGAVLFDHCNSPARAYGLPSALYSGILETQDGYQPKLNTIRGWITDNTLVTEQMKDFFTDFNLPLISPTATSNQFLNGENYPTFVRSIQGDSTIASALATLVKSIGLQYVSVVYSPISFGRDGLEAFSNIAFQEGICVTAKYEMGSMTAADIVDTLVNAPTHVVITYLGLEDMMAFLTARGQNSLGQNLVVISPEPFNRVYQQLGDSARNVMSLRIKTGELDGYLEFLRDMDAEQIMEHPMMKEYYMDLFQCNLPGEYRYSTACNTANKIPDNNAFHVDNYVLPFINSVYTFVAAAHETLKIKCGENYDMVCTDFYSDEDTNTILQQKMGDVSFVDESGAAFQFIGREGNTGREIVMFDGTNMVPVADFAGASISFQNDQFPRGFEDTKSSCKLPCTECINNRMNFTFIPGDILLGGIFDVHEADLLPFSCGEINTLRGFQLLEAFHFALNQVNDKSGSFANILRNVRLGGIGLDACQSSARGGYLVSNIHNGLSQLERNGMMIDSDDIEAYIGSYSSDRSIYLGRLLKSLKIPQVSYGSTSVQLLDQDRYPYFIRTVPADDRQALAMLKFLQKFDIRFVQVVHTADNYGEQAAAIFNKLAEEEQICVAQTISYPWEDSLTVEANNDVVLSLLEKPIANTVIVFSDSLHINELFKAIRRNPEAPGKFKFIGSDTWANTKESTAGVEDLAVDSVTLDLDVVDLREFDDYLATKTPSNYPENPWFPEYYENIHNCYLTIPDNRYPERCEAAGENIVASKKYKQDTAIIHVINAVFASAIGLDKALRQECGEDYSTVCEKFKNLENRRDLVLEMIKEATFEDMSEQDFSFSDRGDGNKGYILYSLDTSQVLGYVYNPIAKFSSEGELTMTDNNYSPSWDGSCNRADACTECPTIRNPRTRYMLTETFDGPQSPATVVILLPIHQAGIDEYQCGEMNEGAMTRALALKYAVETTSFQDVSPFGLRVLILDTCGNNLRMDQDLFSLFTTGGLCNAVFSSGETNIDASSVIGVFVVSSRDVVAANRVTAPFGIQLLSSVASSTALSEQWRYPYFVRTVPPDNLQMAVVGEILKLNKWSYISVLYSSDSYGINGFRTLRNIVNDGQFSCIGYAAPLPVGVTAADVRPLIKELAEVNGIHVIVVMTDDTRAVLEAIVAEGVARRFVLIGTDTWADNTAITAGLAEQFAGAITISFRDAFYGNFINGTLRNINMAERDDTGIPNDWFDEYYQHIHGCRLSGSSNQADYSRVCVDNEVFGYMKAEAQRIGLRDIAAMYALRDGLATFYRRYGCAGSSFAECIASVDNGRQKLFEHTLASEWDVGSTYPREEFYMEIGDKRYWDIGYNIQYLLNDNVFSPVGSQKAGEFNFDRASYNHGRGANFMSACPENQFCDCNFPENEAPQQQAQQSYMGDHEPRNYFSYDEDTGEQVYDWPIWAIAVAVLSCLGLLVGIVLFLYFLIFYPIRGGTTILGFMMMIGIFGIYAINFAYFLQASADTCGARRFCQGVVYAIVFAALLVKAVDNWRFKDSDYSTERYRGLTNPLSLVLIAIGIVLVQCIIPIEWLILEPPSASLMDDAMNQHDWMWCDPHDFYDISMVLSMVFVVFLVVLTAVFAALAWDSESNYYESRWIFISCICTCGCFLVWMVVTTNAGPPFRDPSIAIANFVNGTALLIFIPIRKLVLMIRFKSEEKEGGVIVEEPGQDLYSTVYSNKAYEADLYQAEKPNSDGGY